MSQTGLLGKDTGFVRGLVLIIGCFMLDVISLGRDWLEFVN